MTHLQALVVDDSPSMRKQVCYALARLEGMATTEAADGAEAWRKLATAAFDIVLTDINMPLMDGLKLIGQIRHDPAQRTLPIVVITTEAAEADRARAMSLGASAYLVKPVKAQSVLDTVKELLQLE